MTGSVPLKRANGILTLTLSKNLGFELPVISKMICVTASGGHVV